MYHATSFSLKGMLYCFKNEAGMREYTMIFLASIPFAIYLGESPVERILMLGAGLLVILMEYLNSAIETTLDRISLAHHDLTGAAKDMGSASVFVAALFFVYVWGEFIYRHFS
ncbi:diacylglycerol kinase [Oceanospirillaceae bacterium]|nr:diacylglycerol kinase [Oceanospirillaceae bacterium]MDC1341046.1 diacylglycerol kinase [Oceanospirillaceae bacterium]